MTPPTKEERFFRLMRRWAGICHCMATLSERERTAIESLFLHREGLRECAKRLGVTQARARGIRDKVTKLLSDMLLDDQMTTDEAQQ